VVNTYDEHRSITGWCRDDDFLSSSLKVKRGFGDCCEDSSGFADVFSAKVTPWNVGWVTFSYEFNLDFTVNDEGIAIYFDGSYITRNKWDC
jgi:hypothetical protein